MVIVGSRVHVQVCAADAVASEPASTEWILYFSLVTEPYINHKPLHWTWPDICIVHCAVVHRCLAESTCRPTEVAILDSYRYLGIHIDRCYWEHHQPNKHLFGCAVFLLLFHFTFTLDFRPSFQNRTTITKQPGPSGTMHRPVLRQTLHHKDNYMITQQVCSATRESHCKDARS